MIVCVMATTLTESPQAARSLPAAEARPQAAPTSTGAPPVVGSALDLIGRTPMVELSRVAPGERAAVLAKLEFLTPGGSVKDRLGLGLIESLERAGRLQPGGTLVEPTAGNTGIGLALVGAQRGYNVILCVPERFSMEKQFLMQALGGRVERTPDEEGMKGAIRRAHEIAAEIPGALVPQQFENQGNPDIHYQTTGPEIWEQLEGRVDAVAIGVGTGGTFTGVSRYLKEQNPEVHCVAVEPNGSILQGGEPGPHEVEGIGVSFIPGVLGLDLIDEIIMVHDDDSFATAALLARHEGLLVGGSRRRQSLRGARDRNPAWPGQAGGDRAPGPGGALPLQAPQVLAGAAALHGDPKGLGLATRAIHGGQPPDPTTGAVAVPIYQTSTFVRRRLEEEPRWGYSRTANPTRAALEENVALLEGGESGHAFATGMAAAAALVGLLESGEHVVAANAVYGGTHRLFARQLTRQGLSFSWVDATRPEAVREAIRPETRLVWVESPTNPTMTIADLATLAEIAHCGGARLAVDNTFLSPYFQRPLELGADFVVHSTTKFLNGHSDALGGVVVTRSEAHREALAFQQKAAGAVLGPFDSFLTLRGIKTLPVRMERHQATATRVAHWLRVQPEVGAVFFPGFEEHPGHQVHRGQASGDGGVVSFELSGIAAVRRFVAALELAGLAESLGGVETLVSHPATMSHTSLTAAERAELGITDGLVRLSVGLEDADDIQADLERGLAAVAAG